MGQKMAHFLDASQLAEECNRLGLEAEASLLLAAAQVAGEAIARARGIALTVSAGGDPEFGRGLCVGFGPAQSGQTCPADFADYDAGSDWAEGATDDDEDDLEDEDARINELDGE
jgi:hypothetical protein